MRFHQFYDGVRFVLTHWITESVAEGYFSGRGDFTYTTTTFSLLLCFPYWRDWESRSECGGGMEPKKLRRENETSSQLSKIRGD